MVVRKTSETCQPGQARFESIATDHKDNVLTGLQQLKDRQQLFDVTLVVGDQKFAAHKVVLASCSEYFRAMFTDGLKESEQKEIPLNGVKATAITSLIDFAYSSQITLNFDNIEDILLSASHIHMVPVLDACTNFMKEQLSIENCANMASWADMIAMKELQIHIRKFMCRNFSSLSHSPEFNQLTYQQLIDILACNYPVDCSEMDVLSAVLSWVSHEPEERIQHASCILNHVQIESLSNEDMEKLSENYATEKLVAVIASLNNRMQSPLSEFHLKNTGLINTRGYKEVQLCLGGFNVEEGLMNDIKYCASGSKSWKHLTHIPDVPRCDFGQTVMNNKLYVVGGSYSDKLHYLQEKVQKNGFKYDPVTQTWSPVAPMMDERCRFYLGQVNGKLYAVGGDPAARIHSFAGPDEATCECYNPSDDTWTAIEPLGCNSSMHAGITVDDCLYISGGTPEYEDFTLSRFCKYDTNRETWIALSPLLVPRTGHTHFLYDGFIYVIGGMCGDPDSGQSTLVPTIDRYIEDENRWETVGVVPNPRSNATYTVMDNYLFIVGGWIQDDFQRKANTVQICNLMTRSWTEEDIEFDIWKHMSCKMYLPCFEDLD